MPDGETGDDEGAALDAGEKPVQFCGRNQDSTPSLSCRALNRFRRYRLPTRR
jgi:hypothetical protein